MGVTAIVPMEISELGLKGKPLFTVDKWDVCEMRLSWEKIAILWNKLEQHKTLFSDLTRGDFDNYVRLLVQPHTYWLEIYEGDELLGIVYFDRLESGVEAYANLVLFDRKPAEKRHVIKAIMEHMFREFPLNRITGHVPDIYFATTRLLKRLGFKQEGVKREAVLMGGRWVDIVIMGILRSEVIDVVSIRQYSG